MLKKKRQFVKPFVVCATDGYIIDVYGPYEARYNDTKISKDLLIKKQELKDLQVPMMSWFWTEAFAIL